MGSKWLRVLMGLSIVMIGAGLATGASFGDLPLSQTPVRFAIIGDRTSQATPGVYEEIVGEVEEIKPDFVITVGDAIQGYTEDTLTLNSQWDEYFSIIKPLSMPVYLTPGNHDITTDGALATYLHKVGKPYYSFNVRNFHFVVLDVTRWESSAELPKEEFAWLARDLADHKNAAQTLVFYHKPFWYDTIVMGKPDTLHSLFKVYGVDAVFNGHFHTYFSAKIDGILYTALGSSGGITDAVPSGMDYHFTWVTLDDSGINIAPIKKGSVKPWDIVTANEAHMADNLSKYAMKFTAGAGASGHSRASGQAVLELNNISPFAFTDTIRWQTSPNWGVDPAWEEITIGPHEKKEVSFQVISSELYPLPKVYLRFPYAENKQIAISRDLKISRSATAIMAIKPPVIDGILGDSCWANPSWDMFSPEGGYSRTEQTLFYFAYDKENFYLAVRCGESEPNQIRAAATERDGRVNNDDCVGFFLQPDLKIDTAYQIYFNSAGVVFDQKIYRGILGYFSGVKSWNGNYTVKTTKGKSYWDIEACIPLAQLEATAISGQNWGLNFLRKQKRLNTSADWQVPIDYDPQTYGVLRLQ